MAHVGIEVEDRPPLGKPADEKTDNEIEALEAVKKFSWIEKRLLVLIVF